MKGGKEQRGITRKQERGNAREGVCVCVRERETEKHAKERKRERN